MIERAIFVLSGPNDGRQFLRILPDLRTIGLSEATLLHSLPGDPGPAEPMPDLSTWVHHFEASVPRVELALKRGDAVKWIAELARIRQTGLVVLPRDYGGERPVDFERVSSPLRRLSVPILLLPDTPLSSALLERVVIAVKAEETLDSVGHQLSRRLGIESLSAIHVTAGDAGPRRTRRDDITLDIIPAHDSVAVTLLRAAAERQASLLAILAGEDQGDRKSGTPVVKPLIESAERPILVWPMTAPDDE